MLVAISIPIFTAQLEKSREATDLANMRSAYAECSAEALTADTATVTKVQKEVTIKQTTAGWVTAASNLEVGGFDVSPLSVKSGDKVYVIVPCDGTGATITATKDTATTTKTL